MEAESSLLGGHMLIGLALLLSQADPAIQVAPPPAKPKLICRVDEQDLGSHIRPGRRCKTAEEWQIEDGKNDKIPPTMRVTAGQGDGAPHPTRPQ